MSINLATLEAELLDHLGLTANDFVNGLTDVDLLINRSWWKVMAQLKFRETETTTIFSTIIGTRSYDVSALVSPLIFSALNFVEIEDLYDFSHSDLELMESENYGRVYINSSSDYDKPSKYIREGNNLILYKTPDQVYNITLHYNQILGNIPVDGPVIPQEWHEIILYGAVWRGWIKLGDYNRANSAKSYQQDLISEAAPVEDKEKSTVPTAGLEVLGRDY